MRLGPPPPLQVLFAVCHDKSELAEIEKLEGE